MTDLCNDYPNDISENSMGNILIELRSIGLVKKTSGKDEYVVTPKVDNISSDFFKGYISKKLSNYTPYYELLKIKKDTIEVIDIVAVLKSIFTTVKFEDSTWNTYAKYLIIWLKMSDLEIKNRVVEINKGRGNAAIKDKQEQIPGYSPLICIKSFEKYNLDSESLVQRKVRDLLLMDLISEDGDIIISETNIQERIFEEAKKNIKIKQTYDLLKFHGKLKANDIIEKIGDTLAPYKSITSKRQVASVLLSWANFLITYESEGGINFNFTNKINNLGSYYLSFSPSYVIDAIIDFDNNIPLENKRKISDLIFLGILNEIGNEVDLSPVGLKVLNSIEPEIQLSEFIENNEHLESFRLIYEKFDNKKIRELLKNDQIQGFFSGYSESSIKTKLSIYSGWMNYKKNIEAYNTEQR